MGKKRVIKAVNASAPKIITIGEAFTKFEIEKRAKGCVEKTIRNYKQSLEYYFRDTDFNFDTDVTKITRDSIIEWITILTTRGIKPAAINHYLRDCRAFFYWCMNDDNKYIERFKVETVRAQEESKKTFSKDDMKKLVKRPAKKDDMDYVEWRNWAVVHIAYDMGARAGSLVEIQLGDISLSKHTLYLRHTKNKGLANMKLSSACVKALKEYIDTYRSDAENHDYLFVDVAGEQLTYNALAHSFTRYCHARGVMKTSLHGLRHTFATELAENTNGDMIKLQKALGHSSIDMARKYVNMAAIDMGDYDNISPLSQTKATGKGRPKRSIKKGN